MSLVLERLSGLRDLLDSPSINWKAIVIGGLLYDFVFNTVLDIRQYRVQTREKPPPEVEKAALVDRETFLKSQKYGRAKLKFKMVDRTCSTAFMVCVLAGNVYSKLWAFWKPIAANVFKGCEITTGIFTVLTLLLGNNVLDLPFSAYYEFVIEKNFGFGKLTPGLWIKDTLKTWVITVVIASPVLGAIQWIILRYGSKFVGYMCAFLIFLSLASQVIYPTFIAPWFNKFEPLEEGELSSAIGALAKSQNFPLKRLYVVDNSLRSAHSNAYFIGLPWYKQIVLYDTLIKDQTTEQIVAVLAHELGHWKLNHIPRMIVMSTVSSAVTFSFLLLFLENRSFYESLAFSGGEMPAIVALFVYMNALAPVANLLQFAQNFVIRSHEFAADGFAASLGYGEVLKTSLVEMNKSNLSVIDADPLYSAFHYSHPILPERLDALREATKKGE